MYCNNSECFIFHRCKHWYGFYVWYATELECISMANQEVETAEDCEVFETFPQPGVNK